MQARTPWSLLSACAPSLHHHSTFWPPATTPKYPQENEKNEECTHSSAQVSTERGPAADCTNAPIATTHVQLAVLGRRRPARNTHLHLACPHVRAVFDFGL
eukprot:jgi/Ulvmu1/8628/UM046_0031.1